MILSAIIFVTWFACLKIESSNEKYLKKTFLLIAILANLGSLVFFKYFNFITGSVESIFNFNSGISGLELILPIGISFYSFQAAAYSFDVYNGRIKPESHLGYFALFISFFPKLISGPIERGKDFLPQLKQNKDIDLDRIHSGFQLFLWGSFKKVVIADRLKIYADMVFNNPYDYSGKTLILAGWFFTIQIYCDFSAYTDMARGCGKMLGFELSENFNFPYFAKSIKEFWKRWHITLTSWFRDYLYIPLGGNRVDYARWIVNIMIVFLVSGLWHGANWTFAVWGGLHGILYLSDHFTESFRSSIVKKLRINNYFLSIIQILITFNLVAFAWIFFRSDSFDKALYITSNLFVNLDMPIRFGSSQFTTIITIMLLSIFIVFDSCNYFIKFSEKSIIKNYNFMFNSAFTISLLLACFLFGVGSNNFIYFHF